MVTACTAVLLLAGCGSSWTPATAEPEVALQWPEAPLPARVRYGYAMTGMERSASARSVLNVIAGRSSDDDRFVLPVASARSADGRSAVADTGCRCVHLFSPVSSKYLRLTGSGGEKMVSPVGVAFDDDGRLWVSDSAGALFTFDTAGKLLSMRRRIGDLPLLRPTGVAWSRSRKLLYVVDTLAHGVRAIDASGSLKLAFGRRGSGDGELNFPTFIAEAPDGQIYVTDAMNFRIASFTPEGTFAGAFGHHGDGSGDLAMPKGIAVDAGGVVYVVDALFDNVQLFDRSGRLLLTLGGRGNGFGEFWLPSGLSLGDGGELRVCDTYNRRLQVFRLEAGAEKAS